MFDPHGWSEDSYYEGLGKPFLHRRMVKFKLNADLGLFSFSGLLAKAQKVEMDKLEKAKKERTKVMYAPRFFKFNLLSVFFSVCVRDKSPPAAVILTSQRLGSASEVQPSVT